MRLSTICLCPWCRHWSLTHFVLVWCCRDSQSPFTSFIRYDSFQVEKLVVPTTWNCLQTWSLTCLWLLIGTIACLTLSLLAFFVRSLKDLILYPVYTTSSCDQRASKLFLLRCVPAAIVTLYLEITGTLAYNLTIAHCYKIVLWWYHSQNCLWILHHSTWNYFRYYDPRREEKGLILSAILSNRLWFKSTTTNIDKLLTLTESLVLN